MSSVAGKSMSLPVGDCTEESGETEVTSIEGEKCRVVDDGELGAAGLNEGTTELLSETAGTAGHQADLWNAAHE